MKSILSAKTTRHPAVIDTLGGAFTGAPKVARPATGSPKTPRTPKAPLAGEYGGSAISPAREIRYLACSEGFQPHRLGAWCSPFSAQRCTGEIWAYEGRRWPTGLRRNRTFGPNVRYVLLWWLPGVATAYPHRGRGLHLSKDSPSPPSNDHTHLLGAPVPPRYSAPAFLLPP